MTVTVLTASIPERADKLAEAAASVSAQVVRPQAHLIGVDHARRGAPVVLNELAATAASEWLMVLDDDDVLYPDHLIALLDESDDSDVVYSSCVSVGREFTQYNRPFDRELLKRKSVVSHTAMFRREWWEKVDGWVSEWGYDWRFWQRLARAGASFHHVDKVTWEYRFHGANQSVEGLAR